MIELRDLYDDGEDEQFILDSRKEENDTIYLNYACFTPLLNIAWKAHTNWFLYFALCDGRGNSDLEQNNQYLIDQTKDLILESLQLNPDMYEVIFSYNGTTALRSAVAIISDYVDAGYGKYKDKISTYIHPLAHNSLRLNVKEFGDYYKFNNKDFDELYFNRNNVNIIGLPYIDNLIGQNHWELFNKKFKTLKNGINHDETVESSVKKSKALSNFVILDCVQAGQTLFYESNKGPYHKSLATADALCFSGHKVYSYNLGILVIKKKFLNGDIKLNKLHNMVGGGSILGYNGDEPIYKDDIDLVQAGIKNSPSIIALGAVLDLIKRETCEVRRYNLFKRKRDIKQKAVSLFLEELKQFEYAIKITRIHERNYYQHNGIVNITSDKFAMSELYAYLSDLGIITRDGACCVNWGCNKYDLHNLLRFSFGFNTDVESVKTVIQHIYKFLDDKNIL